MKKQLSPEWIVIGILVFFEFAMHCITNSITAFGIFRDELYYLACADHPALGYVDHPPLSIWLLMIHKTLFGDSMFAIRLVPALLGGLTILFTALIVKRLGGKTLAIALAGIAMIFSPVLIAMHTYYSMNSIDIFLWTVGTYLLLRMIDDETPGKWILLGVIVGLGLLNKISMGFFGIGALVAVLSTKQRTSLKTPWPYVAGLTALILFLPFVIWNIQNQFAHLEFIDIASNVKYKSVTRMDFLSGQIGNAHPFALPVLIAAVFFFFRSSSLKRQAHLLGILVLTVFSILLIKNHTKPEYFSPAFPILFSAGAVQLAGLIRNRIGTVLITIYMICYGMIGAATAPVTLPILPVEMTLKHNRVFMGETKNSEGKETSAFHQFYADMFGWENMAKTVSEVYLSLPEEERARTTVFCWNYGDAGAIDYYRNKYPLPPVISPHNNYWIWSKDKKIKPDILLMIGGEEAGYRSWFNSVEPGKVIRCPYAMPYENNLRIFIVRGIKGDFSEDWKKIKNFS